MRGGKKPAFICFKGLIECCMLTQTCSLTYDRWFYFHEYFLYQRNEHQTKSTIFLAPFPATHIQYIMSPPVRISSVWKHISLRAGLWRWSPLSWGQFGLFWIDCHAAEQRAVLQVYSVLCVKANRSSLATGVDDLSGFLLHLSKFYPLSSSGK